MVWTARGGVMDVVDRLAEVSGKVATAVAAVGADSAASPVLAAVVREFETKASKASRAAAKGPQGARDAVVELEQAGDSAKAAAEADPDASEATRTAVLDAHLSICMLKAKL
jgi:Zn-dependent protease with chaperone function